MTTETNNESGSRSWRPNNDDDGNVISNVELVGYYSCDRIKTYLPDSSRLKYYKSFDGEDVFFDLNESLKWPIPSNYSKADGRLLFNWIKLNYNKIKAPADTDRWIEPHFACRITLLSHLLRAYYLNHNWTIRAAKWKGTIYLAFGRTNRQAPGYSFVPSPFPGISSNHLFQIGSAGLENTWKILSWQHKFIQFIVSDSPNEVPDSSRPVSVPDEFRGVYKIRFGEYTVLFDAPIRGVLSETKLEDPLPLKDLKFVNFQLHKNIHSDRAQKTFRRFKMLKWWAIGFLTNTKEVLCGFRSEERIVKKVKTFTLEDIVETSKNYWKPKSCIQYCESVLKKIAETVVDDCDEMVYEFNKRRHLDDLVVTEVPHGHTVPIIPSHFFEETV